MADMKVHTRIINQAQQLKRKILVIIYFHNLLWTAKQSNNWVSDYVTSNLVDGGSDYTKCFTMMQWVEDIVMEQTTCTQTILRGYSNYTMLVSEVQ